jgi:hypothetical protein
MCNGNNRTVEDLANTHQIKALSFFLLTVTHEKKLELAAIDLEARDLGHGGRGAAPIGHSHGAGGCACGPDHGGWGTSQAAKG